MGGGFGEETGVRGASIASQGQCSHRRRGSVRPASTACARTRSPAPPPLSYWRREMGDRGTLSTWPFLCAPRVLHGVQTWRWSRIHVRGGVGGVSLTSDLGRACLPASSPLSPSPLPTRPKISRIPIADPPAFGSRLLLCRPCLRCWRRLATPPCTFLHQPPNTLPAVQTTRRRSRITAQKEEEMSSLTQKRRALAGQIPSNYVPGGVHTAKPHCMRQEESTTADFHTC